MKTYELIYPDGGIGVFKVSLVKNPAVETTLMKFSSEEKMYFSNEEKRVVYAPAMIPNKMIFRNNIQGEPANVFYTAETIEKLQQNYFRNKGNFSTNLDHADNNIEGVFPFESWIVQNKEIDKSKDMGFDVPNGTWMMGHKIDNDSVWNDYIKTGKIDGLSIEASLLHKEQLINKVNMSKLDAVIEAIKQVFSADEQETVEMAGEQKEISVGDKSYFVSGELIEGAIVNDADGNPVANAEFEYEGVTYKTDDMGAVLPIEDATKEAETPEDVASEPAEADVEDLSGEATGQEDNASMYLQTEIDSLKAENASLKEQLAKAEADKVKAETDLTKMAKETPAAVAIKNAPKEVSKTYAEMSNFEKLKFNRENKR
jgi:hypothetical protein